MKLWNHYRLAHSVEEALALLAAGDGQIIGGGTDLLLDIQQGNHPPIGTLVDVTHIPEMTAVHVEGEMLTLGAGMTHSAIVAHPTIRARATCLAESCGVVGGPQVRNVATIGGNVAHALPAADGTLSLVALGAEAEIATRDGRIWQPMEALFNGPGDSAVDPRQALIVRFRFRLAGSGEASAFRRIMRPQGVALPIMGCAVRVGLDTNGTRFTSAAICIGPTGPTPEHAARIEARLVGAPAITETIREAAAAARGELRTRTSKYRATAAYRVEMVELLLREALEMALHRAQTGAAEPVIGA